MAMILPQLTFLRLLLLRLLQPFKILLPTKLDFVVLLLPTIGIASGTPVTIFTAQ